MIISGTFFSVFTLSRRDLESAKRRELIDDACGDRQTAAVYGWSFIVI
jgi:hypothetical protein